MTDTQDANVDWIEQLKPATAGLLFLSETDAPVVPFVWETPEGDRKSVV